MLSVVKQNKPFAIPVLLVACYLSCKIITLLYNCNSILNTLLVLSSVCTVDFFFFSLFHNLKQINFHLLSDGYFNMYEYIEVLIRFMQLYDQFSVLNLKILLTF